MNLFRNLHKDEIEVRRGRNVGKEGKVELLLYKTARTDMNLLDETFGYFGWAVQYKEENGILFCGLGIQDKESKVWVWRWNAGSEGNFEKEKAVASDSLKRAGFLFGLGRELYTAPRIVIKPKNDYEQFYVDEIEYDEKNRIYNLRIVNEDGTVVYNMVNGKVVEYTEPEIDRVELLKTVCGELKNAEGVDKQNLLRFYNYYENRADGFDKWNDKLVRKLWARWNERR